MIILDKETIIKIVEATNRLKFLKDENDFLLFKNTDKNIEESFKSKSNFEIYYDPRIITLKRFMEILTSYLYEDYRLRGFNEAKRQINNFLKEE